jgi:hypothetical protein
MKSPRWTDLSEKGETDSLVLEPTLVPDGDWTSAEEYGTVVRKCSASKAQKRYAACQGLIINHNAWPMRDPEKLTLEWWIENTCEARQRFAKLWIFGSDAFEELPEHQTRIGIST